MHLIWSYGFATWFWGKLTHSLILIPFQTSVIVSLLEITVTDKASAQKEQMFYLSQLCQNNTILIFPISLVTTPFQYIYINRYILKIAYEAIG